MRAALFCSALASVFLFDACGSSSCPDKGTRCLGVCAVLDSDPMNCGACGNACGTGEVCTAGACTVVCPAGSTVCNNLCVNTDTDQANCGTCGNKCPSGQACGGGACGTSCLAGFTACANDAGQVTCANELTDSANCGGCASACPSGSVCNGDGTCAETCASGFTVCATDGGSGYCANFITDNENCGVCGSPCASGEACSAGRCATSCALGYGSCGGVDGGVGTCADFLTDSNNCGSCGKACPAGQSCTGGSCAETCASGFSACGGGDGGAPFCANFLTDSANCGSCAKPCPSGQVCNGSGVCAETCGFGFSACPSTGSGPYCALLTNDANNCSACGKACAAGSICKSSTCTETCAIGYRACVTGGGDAGAQYCANINNDDNNCGACGNICASGKSCVSQKCTESCSTGYNACSNSYCADLTSDADNCGKCGTTCASSFTAPACCSSKCTSLATGDPNNCGTCGTVCGGGNPGCCAAGCVDEATDKDNCGGCGTVCNGIEPACCSSGCVDESDDKNNCGSCGNACKTGTSPTCCYTAAAGGACADVWTDTNNCGTCGNVCSTGICVGNCCNAACGSDTTTNCQGACDVNGACTHPGCNTGFGCNGGVSCKTTCTSNNDCASNYTCWNTSNGSCCAALANGANMYVDGKLGANTNCCDSASTPCLTITYAMKQIAAAGATGVTINAAWNADPSVRADWAPATAETYPIHLGYGVTVKAPGIFFTPAAPVNGAAAVDAFDVYAYKGGDTGAVTIEGTSTDYMFIGFDSKQKNLTGTAVAVNSAPANDTAVPLTLNKVWLNGQTEALNLGAGATVSLGPSKVIVGSGANTASPLTAVSSPGSGINCKGAAGSLATLLDVDAGGSSVLDVDQMDTGHLAGTYTVSDIYLYDYCNITLSQSPVIGLPPPCPTNAAGTKVDGEGILDLGGSTLSLTGATVQCMYNHGIDLGETVAGATFSGTPTVKLDKTLIQYTGQTGLKVVTGSVGPVTNSTLYHCRFGAVIDGTGAMDLSGGGNIMACCTNQEPGAFGAANAAGINVWNDSTNNGSIDASNVAWDNKPPDYWTCTDGAGATTSNSCTCASGSCNPNSINVALPDNSDAVTMNNTNATPIDTSNPSLQTTYTCSD